MNGTAVDTNILSEIFLGGPRAASAVRSLKDALAVGPVLASGIVYTELCGVGSGEAVVGLLSDMGIELDAQLSLEVWDIAAAAWRTYLGRRRATGFSYHCPACGQANETFLCVGCGTRIGGPRHILADFLIGAHASVAASCLLTWDRGIYRTYFTALRVIHPSV